MRIWRLPQVLVVVIKRFTPDGRKIHTRMAPLEGGALDCRPFFSSTSPEHVGVLDYTLQGIVDHHGSARGGHYTAQARHSESGAWHLYDDEGVLEIGDGRPVFGESTYMLVFTRAGGTGTAAA